MVREEVTHPEKLTDTASKASWFCFLKPVKEFIPLMFSAVFFLPMFLPLWKMKTRPPGIGTLEPGHAHLLKVIWFPIEPDNLSLLYFALSRK